MADKRYGVFISSTYQDLKDERERVMRSVLRADCFPVGMELFSAGSTPPWERIAPEIERSDYYVLIIGARYGSVAEDGVSFTEREFDYAVQVKVPVLAFVHADPDAIAQGKTDKNDEAREKLQAFRAKVRSGRWCEEWRNPDELANLVSNAIWRAKAEEPRPGWVRGSLPCEEPKDVDPATPARPQTSELREYLRTGDHRALQVMDSAVRNARDSVAVGASRPLPDTEYLALLDRVEQGAAGLIDVGAEVAYFGTDEHHEYLLTCFEELLRPASAPGGFVQVIRLRGYPAVLLFYAAGIASVAKGSYARLRPLYVLRVQDPESQERVSALKILTPEHVLQGPCRPPPTPGEQWRTPTSDRIFDLLKNRVTRLPLVGDGRYDEAFVRFEYLTALAASLADGAYPYYGRFLWQGFRSLTRGGIGATIAEEMQEQGTGWPPFRAGLFGGDFKRVLEAKAEVDAAVKSYRFAYR